MKVNFFAIYRLKFIKREEFKGPFVQFPTLWPCISIAHFIYEDICHQATKSPKNKSVFGLFEEGLDIFTAVCQCDLCHHLAKFGWQTLAKRTEEFRIHGGWGNMKVLYLQPFVDQSLCNFRTFPAPSPVVHNMFVPKICAEKRPKQVILGPQFQGRVRLKLWPCVIKFGSLSNTWQSSVEFRSVSYETVYSFIQFANQIR